MAVCSWSCVLLILDCVPFGLLLKFLCQLVEARSRRGVAWRGDRLYRRRFLQVNTRWKALDAIYNISVPLHRSKLKIFRNFHQNVDEISRNIHKILHFLLNFDIFRTDFDEIFLEFHEISWRM